MDEYPTLTFPVMSRDDWRRSYKDPTLFDRLPKTIPWELIAPHADAAYANHHQTLERLASRGGLDPTELYYVLNDKKWPVGVPCISIEDAAKYLIEVVSGREA